MAAGYDGRELIAILGKYLRPGASLLELGMGPGTDLDLLNKTYRATGSDYAQPFLDHYRKLRPQADVLLLDAVDIQTERTFDAVYSNKVLYHLTREELRTSLCSQAQRLNPGGIALHSFWYGEGEQEMHGLRFVYYTPATFAELVGEPFEIVETARYTEMDQDDSFYVVLRAGR
jgi:SAM-dependent methyltransferase